MHGERRMSARLDGRRRTTATAGGDTAVRDSNGDGCGRLLRLAVNGRVAGAGGDGGCTAVAAAAAAAAAARDRGYGDGDNDRNGGDRAANDYDSNVVRRATATRQRRYGNHGGMQTANGCKAALLAATAAASSGGGVGGVTAATATATCTTKHTAGWLFSRLYERYELVVATAWRGGCAALRLRRRRCWLRLL